ncbi:hypothetical protein PF049_00165 [Erythrobacteraceae bacterium WH01K]|nr:hypothetical protein PF049_00165 [Erythrobacteraceae bacterium WH01K]
MAEDTKPTLEEVMAELEAYKESISKLQSKNSELIGKAKDAKAEAIAAKEERDSKAEEAERNAGDITALEKRLTEKYEKQIAEKDEALSTLNNELRTIRVDNEIGKVLDSQSLLPGMKEILSSHYKAQAKYEDGAGSIDGKPLEQFITEHLNSEAGAHYKKASDSSGANASGNTSTTAPEKEYTRENVNLTELSQLAKTDPAKANAIAAKAGLPPL